MHGPEDFDLLIIGGGITGAFLALDSALRGFSVALVEKGDFGAATSAASSKLLHGGVRYLQQLRFSKVHESAVERIRLLNMAPQLVRWVPFVVPTYKGLAKGRPFLMAGMTLYRLLCMGEGSRVRHPQLRLPPDRLLDSTEIRELVPGLKRQGLTGGYLFHELHMTSSERMTLAVMATAVQHGAKVWNHAPVDGYVLGGSRVAGVRGRDLVGGSTYELRARVVLNAAGPWIPQLNCSLPGGGKLRPITGLSRGAHIVTKPITRGCAVALPTTRRSGAALDRGGRHVFVIPWRGRSLIGTSYGPHDTGLDSVRPSARDIQELLDDVNAALGSSVIDTQDVDHAFAGIYPLVAEDLDPGAYQGTGDYQVLDHEREEGIAGLFSVLGAKYTTARLLAERAVDAACRQLGAQGRPCQTRTVTLADPGSAIEALVRGEPRLGVELSPGAGVRAADVVHAVSDEMAWRLEDVVFRRTGLGTLGDPGPAALARAAALMGDVLGWDDERRLAEIARVREYFPR